MFERLHDFSSMEKGHKVCKLSLLKKFDFIFKSMRLDMDTGQIILSAWPSPHYSSNMKFIDVQQIKDVNTLNFILRKMQILDKWHKDQTLKKFDESMILVINWGSAFVLNSWILLFENCEACTTWCLGLRKICESIPHISYPLKVERWLRKQFNRLMDPKTGTITIKNMIPFIHRKLQCKTSGEIGFEAFSLVYKNLLDSNSIFQKYFFDFVSGDNNIILLGDFCRFLNSVQGDESGLDDVKVCEFLRHYLSSVEGTRDLRTPILTTEEFTDYLFSPENSLFDPTHFEVVHDMDRPLSHYFINSSHNTYLTGDQLKSESSLDAYSRSLMMGCRCIELDCWDGPRQTGPDGEIEVVIYHGYTMTSKILLKDVLNTIKNYAFKTSEYPVILSIEDNCSIQAQRIMAREIKQILGDLLLTQPILPNEWQLPSPSSLKHKIILKHKKIQSNDEELCLTRQNSFEDDQKLSMDCPVLKRGILRLLDKENNQWKKKKFTLTATKLYHTDNLIDEDSSSSSEDDEENSVNDIFDPVNSHVFEEWFHGKIDRDIAKQRLLDSAKAINDSEGLYLLRESTTFIGDFTLSFLHQGYVFHCRVKSSLSIAGDCQFYFFENCKKDTLLELVNYYTFSPIETPHFTAYLSKPCPQPQSHINEPWYFETASKEFTEQLLNSVSIDGIFLVRHSDSDKNVFVISIYVNGRILHYRLKRFGRLFVAGKNTFESLKQLVEHFEQAPFLRGVKLKVHLDLKNNNVNFHRLNEFVESGYYMDLNQLTINGEKNAFNKESSFEKMLGQVSEIDLAGCTLKKFKCMEQDFAFQIVHTLNHWNVFEYTIAVDSSYEYEDWMKLLHQQIKNYRVDNLAAKEKQCRIAPELSILVIYCQAVPFNPDFYLQDPKHTFFEMCSFSESKHEKFLERGLHRFNTRQISRVTSTNFNPVPMWNSGCQMVALNFQTGDRNMQINIAKFLANGRCGYVLKPQFLMDETFNGSVTNASIPISLNLTIVAGRHIASSVKTNSSICSPFVEIEVIDGSQGSTICRTRTITSMGLNPSWHEQFQFTISYPELSYLRFVIEDGDFLGPKVNPFLGQATFPVDCLRQGYRSVSLLNNFSEPIEMAALLVHLEIRTLEDKRPLKNMHSFLQSRCSTIGSRSNHLARLDNAETMQRVSSQARILNEREGTHSLQINNVFETSQDDNSQVKKSISLKRLLRVSK